MKTALYSVWSGARKMGGSPAVRNSVLFATCAMLAFAGLCSAQTMTPSLTSSIEVVRADTQADRVTIITQSMNFSEKDAAAFWPIYRKYEYERSLLDDRRVAVIKSYSDKFPNLTDSDAKSMAQEMFDCEARLAELKKRYFKKFNEVLPALKVTTFFQVEHRLDLLVDMRVESSLPPLTRPGDGPIAPQQEPAEN